MLHKCILILVLVLLASVSFAQGLIINHNCTQIAQIPESAITSAKQKLHIAYGHTSHGSQITDGMTGLVAFMNGLGYTNNLYAWNNGGTSGALDLHDYAMGGDVGYYPDWVNNTRSYLGTPDPVTGRGTGTNADVNVIIWSWCGQVTSKYASGTLTSEYLAPMTQLEADYPGIKFIYMTGHLDHSADANNKAANQAIRDYCNASNKILYDFADIESYNPDKTYFQYSNDDCSYYTSTGTLLGNWATEWQTAHTVNVHWYNCSSAHSQPLNANQKAYGAWWLWARLGGWNGSPTGISDCRQDAEKITVYPNPSSGRFNLQTEDISTFTVEVFNIAGTRILTSTHSPLSTSGELDLSGYPEGLYLLKIGSGERTSYRKIILK